MNILEKFFVALMALSLLVSVEMLIDLPQRDVPDIKDVVALFPNLNPPAEAE